MANEIAVGHNHLPIYSCFTCKAFISPTASNCRFCGVPVDYEAARSAADQQARLNQAASRAKALRGLRGAFVLLFLLSLIVRRGPRTSLVLLVVLSMLLAFWWIRAGSSTANRDFRKARSPIFLALTVCGGMDPV